MSGLLATLLRVSEPLVDVASVWSNVVRIRRNSEASKASGKSGAAETKSDTSLFGIGTGDEETLLRLLEAAVRIYGGALGDMIFFNIIALLTELEDGQRKDIRLLLHNMKLAERQERRLVDEIEIPAKGGVPAHTQKKHEWITVDYQFTRLDPRVRLLARIGFLVESIGATATKNVLITMSIIKKESVEAKALRVAGEATEKALDATYWTVMKHRLQWESKLVGGGIRHVDRYSELLADWLTANPGKKEHDARQDETFHQDCLAAVQRRAAMMECELQAAKKRFLPDWAKALLTILGIIAVGGMIVISLI